jgi:hypothetical protein
MSARPELLNEREKALFISIMWLENIPEYEGQVMCLDVDLDSGRVTLYGEVGMTSEFNAKLEEMVGKID